MRTTDTRVRAQSKRTNTNILTPMPYNTRIGIIGILFYMPACNAMCFEIEFVLVIIFQLDVIRFATRKKIVKITKNLIFQEKKADCLTKSFVLIFSRISIFLA